MCRKSRPRRRRVWPKPSFDHLALVMGVGLSVGALTGKTKASLKRREDRFERDALAAIAEAFSMAEEYDPDKDGVSHGTDNYLVGIPPTPEGLVDYIARSVQRELISRHELREDIKRLECIWTSKMVDCLSRRKIASLVDQLIGTSRIWYDEAGNRWCIAPSVIGEVLRATRTSRRPRKVDRHALIAA